MTIIANDVFCTEIDGIVSVSFVDQPEQPVCYLLLQQDLNANQQDKRLAHDGPYVEVNSQLASGYPQFDSICLSMEKLAITIGNGDLADRLGDNHIDVVFVNLDKIRDQRDKLMESLKLIFGDKLTLN